MIAYKLLNPDDLMSVQLFDKSTDIINIDNSKSIKELNEIHKALQSNLKTINKNISELSKSTNVNIKSIIDELNRIQKEVKKPIGSSASGERKVINYNILLIQSVGSLLILILIYRIIRYLLLPTIKKSSFYNDILRRGERKEKADYAQIKASHYAFVSMIVAALSLGCVLFSIISNLDNVEKNID